MKNIINKTAILFGSIAGIVMIMFCINKPRNILHLNSSSNDVDVVGTWIQDDILYYREAKKIDKPIGNLSDAYGEIKMIFNANFTYKSYFDNTSSNGEWKIENDSLYMIDHNKIENKNFTDWVGFKYKLNNDELFIYAYPWLMALKKNN